VGIDQPYCIIQPTLKKIIDGDIILIDAGAEYYGYVSDITRTFPANGKYNDIQREIYDMVLKIQEQAIRLIRPGLVWRDLQKLAYNNTCDYLLKAGYLQGSLEEMISHRVCGLFFPHGLGHYLGLDVHDTTINPSVLEKNTVVTVEPGIYFNSAFVQMGANDPYQSKYLVLDKIQHLLDINFGGIRIEDDILVTSDGWENLTKAPRTVAAIEYLMRGSTASLSAMVN